MKRKTGAFASSYLNADTVSVRNLPNYLCDLAAGERVGGRGKREIMPEMCRQCESQCAFGRRLVEMEKAACAPTQTAKKGKTKRKGQTHDNTRNRKAQGTVAGSL